MEIGQIEKHPDADSLSITTLFDSVPVIFRTGDFKTGDKAVYIPIDSIVPPTERWAFIGNNRRIKAKRLRGIFSMGLLSACDPDWQVGDEVSEALGITEYQPPIGGFSGSGSGGSVNISGDAEPDPGHVPKYTDIESVRKLGKILLPEEEVVVTEKIHGANMRVCWSYGRLWVGSRNQFKRESEDSVWWQAARAAGLEEKLAKVPGLVLYGELYGNVQDLKYGLPAGAAFVAFDAYLNLYYLNFDVFSTICRRLDIPMVPVLYRGPYGQLDRSLAEGRSVLADGACIREGFVVRPTQERRDHRHGRVILKLAGEGYLTRRAA
ncbi:MAG: RNA ligase family protein [Novosphingobium sp.]